MTRINCVPVADLTNLHLLAEYKELPRVFPFVVKAIQRGEFAQDYFTEYSYYRMGSGHLKFFYPRLEFLFKRFEAICSELSYRGYDLKFSADKLRSTYSHIGKTWCSDWVPSPSDISVSRMRIQNRLEGA